MNIFYTITLILLIMIRKNSWNVTKEFSEDVVIVFGISMIILV